MSRPDPPGRKDRIASIALICAGRPRTNLHITCSLYYNTGYPATTLPPSLRSGPYPGPLPAYFQILYSSAPPAFCTPASTAFAVHLFIAPLCSSSQLVFSCNNNQMQRKTKTTADVTPRGASKNIRLCRR